MPIDTEDKGLIQDCEDDPKLGRLVALHSQVSEHSPNLAALIEILVDGGREACAAKRSSAPAPEAPAPEPKRTR